MTAGTQGSRAGPGEMPTSAPDPGPACGPYVLPASFAQERLWFFSQLVPDLAVYNIGCPIELSSLGQPQDADRLEAAFAEVVGRHETLRTCLSSREGELVQLVHPDLRPAVTRADLRDIPADQRVACSGELARKYAATPIPLDRPPLWRAHLIRRDDDDWLFVFVAHHSIFDGQSTFNFITELRAAYIALTARPHGGAGAQLPQLQVQYGDFAAWQRSRLAAGEMDEQIAYWKGELADFPPPLRLPAAVPLAAGEDGDSPLGRHRGGDVAFTLGEGTAVAVGELARDCATTPFVVLLSAFAALLSRLTGQTDIVVGSPVSGRITPELAPLIGMFVNTLVLRVDCSGAPAFADLVRRVRGTVLDALDHQEVPYDRLVELLHPERDAGGSALHQVGFNLLPFIANEQIRNGTAKFDLVIDLAERHGRYDGQLEYRTDLFDESAATAFAHRLSGLLDAALADPGVPLSRLPIMVPGERGRVLAAAASPSSHPQPVESVTELFARQVAAHPDAAAVADITGRSVTYRELDRRSNQLARHLAARAPLGQDTPVALLLENNVELAVAVLAVLKTGAAYLPLDDQHPPERMRYLIEDAGAAAIITRQDLAGRVPTAAIEEQRTPLITIGALEIALQPDTALDLRVHPDALAYVIYTSGSTGKPKGVGVTHRNLAAYVDGVAHVLTTGPGRVFSMLQSLTFDFAVTMFHGALLTGGTLCLAPRDYAADAHWVAEHLRKDQVDYLKITPSHLLALQAGTPDPAALLPRRALILGGEASNWAWVRGLSTQRPGCAVINHYGPTETTVGVLALTADRAVLAGTPVTPLGRPMSHARAYVLDENLDLVPDAVAGELCIGGATVSRGYLGRPALTADRFVPDPFSANGARLYRTGDRARRMPGGEIEFLGRFDDQVKVRGYRVELGEVQQVLAANPQIADCAVVLRQGSSHADDIAREQPQLVAYVVTAAGAALDIQGLRAYAEQRLPDFMVPSVFVQIDAMPLAAHGKVDRSRLPPPPREGAQPTATGRAAPFNAPRGAIEEMVASLFGLLLEREQIGREDGFFALGGHSLLAIQLVTRLRAAFGVGMPLRAVFENPTVAGIALKVEAQQHKRGKQLPPVRPIQRLGPVPTSYGQRRLWFLDQLEAGPQGGGLYNTSICVHVAGELDPGVLHRALEQIAARHEVLRSTFVQHDDDLLQVVSEQPVVPFTVVDLSVPAADMQALEEKADRVLAEHASRGFDLAAEPPIRATVVRLSGADQRLLITLHHVANDAWSAVLLIRELGELYSALRQGRAAQLPELEVQYADYAAWQRELLASRLRDTQLAYWRARLAGMPPRLELPADRPRPVRRGYAGAHAGFDVPGPVADRLRVLGADENASLFMTLLAGFLTVLNRYTGQDDLVVGTPAANRPRPELESLIGFFLNTLPLRTDCSGDPTFRELVRRVRATTLEAFANQDVPFEALVEELQPQRDLGSTPLVQVLFTVEDVQRPLVSADGAEFRWAPFGTATAKFDITVYLWRRPEGLTGSVEYRTDVFDATTMRRLSEQYATLLAAAAADADRPISDLPLMSAGDVGRIGEWNSTGLAWPGPWVVPGLVAAAAARWPDRPAVWAGGSWLSLAGFADRVNRWARCLLARGAAAGDRVGVLLERGADLVTVVHGVQAAGAAYVPLDPEYPPGRLAFMCADAGVRLVVTTAGLAGLLTGGAAGAGGAIAAEPPGRGPGLVLVEEETGRLAGQPPGPPPVAIHPDMLAYVIYTSGSTGQPKGVGVSHRAIVNRVLWMQQAFGLGAADRVAHKTPFSFDVSVWELVWPLATGAGMVVADPGGHRDTSYLTALFADQQVSTAHFVPSMLEPFLDEDRALPGGLAARLPALRQVFCSGEALPAPLAERFRQVLPDVALHNLYGPTEAAVDVTWHHCQDGDDPVPIGRPIANTQIRIVDATGEQTPIGVPGELCIAGIQLARGYLNRPALTAAAFTPDQLGPPGSRLYHTGDLARWRPDGTIEYLSRMDHQVKIRGMRVELGEIEAALAATPGLRAAAAALAATPAGPTLTGYLVPASTAAPPSIDAVRGHIAATLPPHMIPTSYQFLPELPLTPNGKLDRNALPDPQPPQTTDYIPPRDQVEARLASIWEQLLGRKAVSITDDFFALGGHSLLALRLAVRIRQELGRDLPVATVLTSPTINELAKELRRPDDMGSASPVVALRTTGERPPLILPHALGGQVFRYRPLAARLGGDQPVFTIPARGLLPGQDPHETLDAMADDYVRYIRSVLPHGPYVLGGFCIGGNIALEVARRLRAEGEHVPVVFPVWSSADEPVVRSSLNDETMLMIHALAGGVNVLRTVDLDELRKLPSEERLIAVIDASAREHRLRPDTADLEQARRYLNVFKANAMALGYYRHEPYDGDVVLLQPVEDPEITPGDDSGWRAVVTGRFAVAPIPGTRFTSVYEPLVAEMAAQMRRWMDRGFTDLTATAR